MRRLHPIELADDHCREFHAASPAGAWSRKMALTSATLTLALVACGTTPPDTGATGGAPSNGGASTTGGSVGTSGSGGSSAGGAPSNGGTSQGGGANPTGGMSGMTGGMSGTTGGSATNGGTATSGGTSTSGGKAGGGGTSGGKSGTTGGAGSSSGGKAGGGGTSTGGAAGGGNTSTGGTAGGTGCNDFVSGVTLNVHDKVNTLIVAKWTQTKASDEVWLEFDFEEGNILKSRAKPGTAGAHDDVALGIPASTPVKVRIVNKSGGTECKTQDYTATTKALPTTLPKATVMNYDPALASPEKWMFGAVENSDGGCTNTSCYYHTTFWLYIMDRKGRMVWYFSDPASNATSSFQRVARDGEYIWIEQRPFGGSGARQVRKQTLDHKYLEVIPVAGLSDAIDVTTDGSLLYDTTGNILRERTKAGMTRDIWNCRDHFKSVANFQCYSNTINWDEKSDSVMLSFPEEATVIQIDRKTGAVVGQYGDAPNSYAFSPSTWEFGYQHFANITPTGTLILSSHMPGNQASNSPPKANAHAFMEFEIDRTGKRLVEKWIYTDGPEWAMYKGMAQRVSNGNTLGNYGTGGVIREITPDKKTVFYVKFDVATGNDFYNKMVGHNVLVNDLYALNGGGPK